MGACMVLLDQTTTWHTCRTKHGAMEGKGTAHLKSKCSRGERHRSTTATHRRHGNGPTYRLFLTRRHHQLAIGLAKAACDTTNERLLLAKAGCTFGVNSRCQFRCTKTTAEAETKVQHVRVRDGNLFCIAEKTMLDFVFQHNLLGDVEELLALHAGGFPDCRGRELVDIFTPGLDGTDADVAGNPLFLAVQLVDCLLSII